MITYHEVTDPEKAVQLAASMEENGWIGAPIVKWGDDFLITGTHRYTAASEILGWLDRDIPMIDLEELFEMEGLDFAALHAKHGNPTIDEAGLVGLIAELSNEIKEEYGLDIH